MKPKNKIKGIKPSARMRATKLVYENVWTYDQADITYDEEGITYDGLYAYDAQSPSTRIKDIKPNAKIW